MLSRSFLLLIFCSMLSAGLPISKPYPKPPLFNSPPALKLYAQRKAIHDKALENIKQAFKISDTVWHTTMDHVHALVLNDHPYAASTIAQADHWLIQEIQKILTEYGLAHDCICIALTEKTPNAYVTQVYEKGKIKHLLELNPSWFSNLGSEEREGILRHEIMHIITYDVLEESYLIGLLLGLGHQEEYLNSHPAIINYRNQRELRADLLAVVDKPKLAHAAQKLYAAQVPGCDDNYTHESWHTHPHPKVRADHFSQLLTCLSAVAA